MAKGKQSIFLIASFVCVFIGFSACKDEPVIPDTPIVKFSDNIQPLIIGNCTASNCHGTLNPQEFLLTSYEDVIKHGDVKPKDARGSKLYQVITTNIKSQKMPRTPYPDLTENQIEMVYLWIMQGAKNN